MHFREKGNRVQFIRTTYDPETKRSKYNVVGAMPRLAREVRPEVLSRLTEDEKREVQTFIDGQGAAALLEGQLYLHRLPHIVALITEYLEIADRDEVEPMLSHLSRAAMDFNGLVRRARL
jgi:hypothetical protein